MSAVLAFYIITLLSIYIYIHVIYIVHLSSKLKARRGAIFAFILLSQGPLSRHQGSTMLLVHLPWRAQALC